MTSANPAPVPAQQYGPPAESLAEDRQNQGAQKKLQVWA